MAINYGKQINKNFNKVEQRYLQKRQLCLQESYKHC